MREWLVNETFQNIALGTRFGRCLDDPLSLTLSRAAIGDRTPVLINVAASDPVMQSAAAPSLPKPEIRAGAEFAKLPAMYASSLCNASELLAGARCNRRSRSPKSVKPSRCAKALLPGVLALPHITVIPMPAHTAAEVPLLLELRELLSNVWTDFQMS